MKKEYKNYVISKNATVLDAIKQMDNFKNGQILILFVEDDDSKILGSVTSGDIRRCFLKGITVNSPITDAMQKDFHYIKNLDNYEKIKRFKEKDLKIIPHVTKDKKLIDFINLQEIKAMLPMDAIIMAGGKGLRLKPYTNDMPKPMLDLAGKPIIAHNIDRLIQYGVRNFYISVNYLKDKIKDYISKTYKNVNITFIEEETPLGTLGSASLIQKFVHDDVLVMNADILTNIDFEDFYTNYKNFNDDMTIATFNIKIDIPYAVLETSNKQIISFEEKPTYTYYSNAGIYLVRKDYLKKIPKNVSYDTIDLMNDLIASKKKVSHFPIRGYWLDIGSVANYSKAKDDIKFVKF